MKKTKIVCSIGPSSNDVDVMEQMVIAGMNVARINFTHATLEERKKATDSVREVRKRTGQSVAILWDTKGPEFRNGVFENDSVELIPGQTIRIVKENVVGNQERFSVNHPEALDSLRVGDIILLENAKMKLEVISIESDGVTCKIIYGGILGNRKSMSVPGIKLNIPYVSDLDREDIKYACEHGGEFLAISFVSSKEDVLEVKEIIKQHHREDLKIICKIESQLGIDNLREILEVSDGVMIGRGDLGAEIPSEEVPHAQKNMIKICREMGKVVITATEMLETMMENSRPKRAETSDIANAVLDGTDAVMLSGETTIGKHPIETVKAMADICEVAEKYAEFDYTSNIKFVEDIPTSIAENVVASANRLNAKLICAATISGTTARIISNLKPKAPILALCPDEKTGRRLALNWGVYPIDLRVCNSTDEVLELSVERAKEFITLNQGDKVVVTGGFPNTDENRTTNLMKIEIID
ncbi:MAG: pyruvate kinase [Bacilli bacterium]|nr:pyruvate kinase [Bacilli bacterium]